MAVDTDGDGLITRKEGEEFLAMNANMTAKKGNTKGVAKMFW